MNEASKGFRKLKAHKKLPILRAALVAHHEKTSNDGVLANEVKDA